MTPPILLIAIGNESRGDDALGPLLLRSLQQQVTDERIEFLEDFQLQVEHAADMLERELVLFIDAGLDTPAPCSFYRARPDDGRTLFSHALTPGAVLATYAQVYRQTPPPSFVLCLRGERFELGEPLSALAEGHLAAAAAIMHELLLHPTPAAWEGRAMAGRSC